MLTADSYTTSPDEHEIPYEVFQHKLELSQDRIKSRLFVITPLWRMIRAVSGV